MGRSSGIVLISAFLTPAFAEETGTVPGSGHDTAIIVTSSRLPEVARAVATEVIDAGEIQARNCANLLELLRGIAGVSLSQPGGPGGVPEVFLRGSESNFTLVMVDGVKMNDPTDSRGGAFDLSSVGIDEIERVEIVRGPVSAVHGSEALAGVINVITRGGTDNRIGAGAYAGSRGYSRLSGQMTGALGGGASASLQAQYLDAGEPTPGSTLRGKSAQARLAYDLPGRMTSAIGLRVAERSRTSFPDASGGSRLAVVRELERSDASDTSLFANALLQLSAQWSLELSGSLFRREDDLSTPPIAPGISDGRPAQTSQTRLHRSNLEVSAKYAPTGRFSVGFGLDAEESSGRRESLVDFGDFQAPSDFSLDRHTQAAFVEGWWRASRGLELFASVRADRTEEAQDNLSKRLGAAFESNSGLVRLHATWGEGFKLPSFYSLGDGLVGNPALERERGASRELGAELRLLSGRMTLGATGFRSVYRDLIDFDFATFRLVNRARAQIDGGELSVRFAAGDAWQIAGHYSRTHADLDSGGRLLNRPDQIAAASAIWRADSRWLLSSTLSYVGDRAASSVPTGNVTLPHYARLDIAATYRLNEAVDLRGAIDNLTNERYQDNPGFPSPGRALRIGINARL